VEEDRPLETHWDRGWEVLADAPTAAAHAVTQSLSISWVIGSPVRPTMSEEIDTTDS
jgi:hypothetical protein